MTGYTQTYTVGNVQAAAFEVLWKPRVIRGASKYGVILAHGATPAGTAAEVDGPAWPEMAKLAAVLANEGIPVIGGYMGNNSYAVDAIAGTSASNYMNKALTYMAAQTGCSSSKAHVIGISMGGGIGVRWAGLNPSKAASVQGVIPMASIEHLYTDNPGLPVSGGFTQGIAGASEAWNLAFRSVTDAVINGTTTLTSATAAFVGGDVGKQIVRGSSQTGIPVNTKIASVTNSTTVVMDKAATTSASGYTIGIAAPFPMTTTTGGDLIGYYAPILASNSIPNRWFYASDDPYIYTADVTALASAASGTAINLGTGGHARATVANMAAYNGGTDFSDTVTFLEANGA